MWGLTVLNNSSCSVAGSKLNGFLFGNGLVQSLDLGVCCFLTVETEITYDFHDANLESCDAY